MTLIHQSRSDLMYISIEFCKKTIIDDTFENQSFAISQYAVDFKGAYRNELFKKIISSIKEYIFSFTSSILKT